MDLFSDAWGGGLGFFGSYTIFNKMLKVHNGILASRIVRLFDEGR